MNHQGVIALDIDGTLTHGKAPVPQPVTAYLESLYKRGWVIFFITGRTLNFAHHSLGHFQMPFYLGIQNGSDIYAMPDQKLVYHKYIDGKVLSHFDEIYEAFEEDYLLIVDDVCLYRPHKLTDWGKNYINTAGKTLNIQGVESFEPYCDIPIIKCFGKKEIVDQIENKLRDAQLGLTIVHNRDVFFPDQSILMITAEGIDKGGAVRHLLERGFGHRPVIAAGDDRNDIPLLKEADVAIMVEGGARALAPFADFTAKGPKEHGLIDAIEEALIRCQSM